MEAFMAEFTIAVTYTTDNFIGSGDLAVEPYAGTATFTPKAGGESMQEAVKGLHIYRRQADGSWKMTHDVWNTDASPPPMN